jgi:hypothetical protein
VTEEEESMMQQMDKGNPSPIGLQPYSIMESSEKQKRDHKLIPSEVDMEQVAKTEKEI